MKVKTLAHKHKIEFSECTRFGDMSLQSCLRWFERERFEISAIADVQDYFFPLHRDRENGCSRINEENEFFTMPVIDHTIKKYGDIRYSDVVCFHTYLEICGGICCFHHYVTAEDDREILLECLTRVAMVGAKTGVRIKLPPNMLTAMEHYFEKMEVFGTLEV